MAADAAPEEAASDASKEQQEQIHVVAPSAAAQPIETPDPSTIPKDLRPLEPDRETPLPRLNAMLVTRGSDLIVYGGLVELGSKELTLDDCWSINLNTR